MKELEICSLFKHESCCYKFSHAGMFNGDYIYSFRDVLKNRNNVRYLEYYYGDKKIRRYHDGLIGLYLPDEDAWEVI